MKAENSAEEQLDSCWAAGRACNFDRAAGEDGAAEGQSSVRADFLRAMILRHFADSSSDTAVAATMTGASISGPLNLNGVVGKKPTPLNSATPVSTSKRRIRNSRRFCLRNVHFSGCFSGVHRLTAT